ncbi:MAG TPA: hypothetical protein VJN64_05135 [Terriglobales bacterium]|nr:hypothetical protein [Terriglobales bacterium]
MRVSAPMLVFLFLLCCASGQSPAPYPLTTVYPDARGGIHTQEVHTRFLQPDPRAHPRLGVVWAEPWLVFDRFGEIAEQGVLDKNGNVKVTLRRSVDQNGSETQHVELPDGSHDDITQLSDGGHQIEWIRDGAQLGRLESEADGDGKTTSRTYDKNDQLTGQREAQYSKHTYTTVVRDGQGKVTSTTVRRTGDDHQTVEASRYDGAGRLISTMLFSKGQLTSFWQDPACQCRNFAGFNFPEGTTVLYRTEPDGKLFKDVQHHPGRHTSKELDDEELYDQTGQLLERINYAYERDSRENWTKRTVSIFDAATNSMVPVQEDVRELTYY